MAFLSGKVSFSRFRVVGGSPRRLDEHLLDKLRENRIGSNRVATPTHEDEGWIGGRHLLDREFDIDKNVLLDCLHLGMRLDASAIPPDLMRAYIQMELDVLYKSNGNGDGNGRSSGKLKRQAKEAAQARVDQEIKEGRYRRLRQFPVLLDTRESVLYFAATTPAVHEKLHPLFKTTFGKNLEPMTAGERAIAWAEARGASRQIENLTPAGFVPHPDGNGNGDAYYWTAHDPASRDFLGNEFLLWLWHELAEKSDTIPLADNTEAAIVIVKQLTLECPWAESGKEVITCDGPTQLPESRRAIQSGKLPRKMGLIVSRQGEQYEFTLQAETFNITAATLPSIDGDGNGSARAEERIEQIRHLSQTVDLLYAVFLLRRLSPEWQQDCDAIKAWLRTGS